MVKWLLYFGLAVCPFLALPGYDQRWLKESFSIGLCLVIALYGLGFLSFKQLQNRWLLLFVAWSFVASLFAPAFVINGEKIEGIWNYRPLFYSMVYLSALWAISNVTWSRQVIDRIFFIMACAGLVMAFVVGLQALGISMFHVAQPSYLRFVPAATLAGTLGHPTLAGQFLVMCLPFVAYLRKWGMLAAMLGAIYLTHSNVAYLAVFVTIVFYLSYGNLWKLILAVALLGLAGYLAWQHGLAADSGRFGLWSQILTDMKANMNTFMYGFGFGSFQYLYPIMHNTPQVDVWKQAHNEYIEILWALGLPGLFFMVRSIFWPLERAWHERGNGIVRTLACAWVAICVCAAGNFVWHLGVFCLYSVVIVGLLTQQLRRVGNGH